MELLWPWALPSRPHTPGGLRQARGRGLGTGGGQAQGPRKPSGRLREASTTTPPPRPCLKSQALIEAFSCTTERKEEKTPTYVVPTQDSDMLTSLLYPVSNLNTERVLRRSGKSASNGPLWGRRPPFAQGPGSAWVPTPHPPTVPPNIRGSPTPTTYPGFYQRKLQGPQQDRRVGAPPRTPPGVRRHQDQGPRGGGASLVPACHIQGRQARLTAAPVSPASGGGG